MSGWLATTVGVIAGGFLTMLSAWMADRRLMARERERRAEERRERLVTRRNDFQRDTLLALQEACQRLLRNAGASLVKDAIAYRTTGQWQRQQLPDELSDGFLQLNTEAMLLSSRVRDTEVRELVEQLRGELARVNFSGHEAEANARISGAADIQHKVIQRVGHLLRELDDAD